MKFKSLSIFFSVPLLLLTSCGGSKSGSQSGVEGGNFRGVRNGTATSGLNSFDPVAIHSRSVGELLVAGRICTATLVGPQTVLTAAHCVSNAPTPANPQGGLIPASSIQFRIEGVTYSVATLGRHSRYLPSNIATAIGGTAAQNTGGADLALVKLSAPQYQFPYVDNFDYGNFAQNYANATLIGMGINEANIPGIKRAGTLNYGQLQDSTELVSYNPSTLRGTFQSIPRGFIRYNLGPTNQIGCQGDSGSSPLAGISNLLRPFVTGVLSQASSGACSQVNSNLVTSASAYFSWIDGNRKAIDPNISTRLAVSVPSVISVNQCFPITLMSVNNQNQLAGGGARNLDRYFPLGSNRSIPMFSNSSCTTPVAVGAALDLLLGQSSRVFYGRVPDTFNRQVTFYQGIVGPLRPGEYFPLGNVTLSVTAR